MIALCEIYDPMRDHAEYRLLVPNSDLLKATRATYKTVSVYMTSDKISDKLEGLAALARDIESRNGGTTGE